MRELDDITGAIVDAALRIHRDLGPGLLESVYEAVLARALERRSLRVERQVSVRFECDGMVFEEGFRVDLVVDDRVIVEVKSVEQLARAHPKLLTYLKLTESAGWSADQLRRSDAVRGAASDRERLSVLGAFAAPREPRRCG